MFKIKELTFAKSIVKQRDRPMPNLPEFAFAGRSNVGKSSLINSLVNRSNFARISKSPGKTRTINYYKINNIFYLVDLPGYGYARVSKMEKKSWKKMVENYLIQNPFIKTVYVLIDCKVGLKETDLELFGWLNFHTIPFKVIFTKSDRISRSGQEKRISELISVLTLFNRNQIILFSAKTKQGREELLTDILIKLEEDSTPILSS
jgi:GTP-binding protein